MEDRNALKTYQLFKFIRPIWVHLRSCLSRKQKHKGPGCPHKTTKPFVNFWNSNATSLALTYTSDLRVCSRKKKERTQNAQKTQTTQINTGSTLGCELSRETVMPWTLINHLRSFFLFVLICVPGQSELGGRRLCH